jgi:hypothetical protein
MEGDVVEMGMMLKELVLLKDLVWSMSYVLIKNLICSNLNYLGASLVIISKTIGVPRIVLKCAINT